MAEGAGALVLESLEAAHGARRENPRRHRTAAARWPTPSTAPGRARTASRSSAASAMRSPMPGLTPDDIDYVNPHGTGTPENDKMEAMGVMAVFGERAKTLPMSSNKSMIGHTLSAAGAVEAVVSLLTLAASAHPADHQLSGARPGDPDRRGAERGARRQGAPRHLQFVRLRRPERVAGDGARTGVTATIRALTLLGDRKLELAEVAAPPPPAAGEVQIAVKAVALNHIDVWGFRGMAFAKRKMPLVVGAEAAGEIAAVGDGVTGFKPGDPVVMYGALTCGHCKACREGRDNLCENVAGIMGFHVDGFARDLRQHAGAAGHPGAGRRRHARRRLRADRVLDRRSTCCSTTPSSSPARPSWCRPAAPASAPRRSRWRRRSAAPSSPRSATTTRRRRPRRSAPITSSTTAPSGSRRSRASSPTRKASTWCSSMSAAKASTARCSCLKRGGRLVTCGSTAGPTHHLQPDAAVPAAVQDLRLVRRLDAQHPRQPRQDGERPPPGHRHRTRPRRS